MADEEKERKKEITQPSRKATAGKGEKLEDAGLDPDELDEDEQEELADLL